LKRLNQPPSPHDGSRAGHRAKGQMTAAHNVPLNFLTTPIGRKESLMDTHRNYLWKAFVFVRVVGLLATIGVQGAQITKLMQEVACRPLDFLAVNAARICANRKYNI